MNEPTLIPLVHMPVSFDPLIAMFVAGAGAAVFSSYAGVVVERGWVASTHGRSRCGCGRTLVWWENVPIWSWVLLRGRCRCRQVRLDVRYVVTETVAVIAAVSLVALGPDGMWAVAPLVGFGVSFLMWVLPRFRSTPPAAAVTTATVDDVTDLSEHTPPRCITR